ncbi:MAG: ABC transporter ATP-binding protein [candidate division WOR-3 bacterium]
MRVKPIYISLFAVYSLFSLISSGLEGISISVLPIILRVLLSSEGEINLIPALKPLKGFIENFLISGDPFQNIRNLSLFVAFIFLAKLIVNSAKKFGILFLQEVIGRDLRNGVFSSLIDADFESVKNLRSGDIIGRLTVEINNVKLAVRDGLGSIVGDGLNLLIFVILAITSAPILSFFAWGILFLSALLGWIISSTIKRRAQKAMNALGDTTSFLAHTFDGIKVIKSLNLAEKFKLKFNRYSQNLFKKYLKLEFSAALAPILSESLVGISASLILLLSGYFIYKTGTVSPDAFIVFLAASLSTIRPLKLIFQSLAYLQTARVSLKRLKEIYDLPKEVWGNLDPRNWEVLELRNVEVKYGQKSVLRIPHLRIKRGEKIVVVGKSGSGKTTFVELLAGFVKPYKGEILLDGKSLYDYDVKKWRELIGFVPQEPYIFEDTLLENFGKNPLEILSSLNLEHLKDRLGEEVLNLKGKLSGGEKQRIAIGRVLLRNPSFLIMDEPTSALDLKNESAVYNLLKTLNDTTLLVVAHKPTTINWGDRILVLENGEIVCDGDIKTLKRLCPEFNKVIAQQ